MLVERCDLAILKTIIIIIIIINGTSWMPANLYTEYEVSIFTHYENMKGDEKCKNWGGLEG